MEFDEIEYLEKTVEEAEDREGGAKKKGDGATEKSDRSYRKRHSEDDGERKRSRGGRGDDGEEKNGDRDREKDRHRRDRDREKDRDRDRERRERRDKEREEERGKRERSRSKSKSRRERSRSRSRSRSRRERSRSRYNDREKRTKDKKEGLEPEADPERDQRTVFAYQMPLKATERDVYEFFTKAGKVSNVIFLFTCNCWSMSADLMSFIFQVRDVRLIMDRNSRRSKGVGYIEFYDVMSVPMAIALSGQLLFGQPVMVKPSEAEKNLVQSTASGATAGAYGPIDRKLYVGNLHFNMTEVQLRQLFEPFGTVELVQLPLDLETGQCKGFGFVQFALPESAKEAQTHLNGKLEIAGRTLKVSSVTEQGGQQDPGAKSADFDDDDGGGLSLNAQSRAMLMQKLDRSGIATRSFASISSSLGVPMLNGSAQTPQTMTLPINGQAALGGALPVHVLPAPAYQSIGKPSECLLLQNMFDPSTETEPDFDLDIKDDVEEECSKYGRVKHIYVEKNSAGFVYLRFDTMEGAARAQAAMHMRWFARRSISATFMPPHEYEAKFPDSR
ncbi:RNA-binding protein 39 [Linum perenne]